MEVVNNKIQRSHYFLLRQAMLFQYSLITINLDKIRMADSRGSLDSPSHKERGHQLGGRLGCEVNALGCPYEHEYWHLALNTLSSLERDVESWNVLGKNGKKKSKEMKERHTGSAFFVCLKLLCTQKCRFMRS